MGKEVRSREVDAAADVKKSIWRRPLPSGSRRRRRRRRGSQNPCLVSFFFDAILSGNICM